MSIQSTVVPQDRIDGTRCVILCPGDVLILAGLEAADEGTNEALEKLRDALGLRYVIACRDLTDVSVRDLDAELAEAQRGLESYGKLCDINQRHLDATMDKLDAAERRVAELEAERR